jgi:hypothetical protein
MLYHYPFFIASSILFLFEAVKISRNEWGGDFWTHSAVVHEFSFHLLHPKNPIIKSDIPHAFYSPYSLLVASFAALTRIDTIPTLEIFAYLNLAFFLVSFYFFSKSIFKERHQLLACASLVLMLLFWGADPPVGVVSIISLFSKTFYHILLRLLCPCHFSFYQYCWEGHA